MPTDERIVDHGRAQVPNLLHELMFGDQAVSMPHEVGQNLHTCGSAVSVAAPKATMPPCEWP